MEAIVNYGLFRKGHNYKVVDKGSDWYLVSIRGKTVYTFRWVFDE